MSLYIKCLLEWNHRINLIGTSDTNRIVNELILDSIIAVPFIPEEGIMLDLGSGAGLPGIVIKILRPSLEITLIDSNRKKTSFLKNISRELGLSHISVINSRVEDIKEKFTGSCDIITSRAMTGMNSLIELCSGCLAGNGIIIGFLGDIDTTELKKNMEAMTAHSLVIDDSIDYTLPGKSGKRSIVKLKKQGPSVRPQDFRRPF